MTDRTWRSRLDGLADPARHTEPLIVGSHPPHRLLDMLRTMLVIRRVEERIAGLCVEGAARTPCHLGIGQEGVAVGVCAHLDAADRVFGGHRSHGPFLAMGGTPFSLIAEVLGRAEGASRGMGGSMHLYGGAFGFHGSVPLVGATIPVAVGAALAARMDGGGQVAVAFFGDGACEEGVFHESLNLAVVYDLPVIFVCENNLFASHLDIQFRQPSDRVARFAEAHHIPACTVDGNDVLAVEAAAARFVHVARKGGGPGFIEAVTYRFRGHVGPNEDIDVGVNRRMEDVARWKQRCPIARLTAGLRQAGLAGDEYLEVIDREVSAAVDAAVERARAAGYPDGAALHDLVYMSQP